MDIKSYISDIAKAQKTKAQFLRHKISAHKSQVVKLENQVRKLQALVRDDILSVIESSATYKGNSYPTYASAVAEINRKYNGTADWGVIQTGSIIDLRSAFIIGEGIKITEKKDGAERELKWAERFIEYNDLDEEVAQEFAKEAEKEGKIALKLALEENKELEEGDEKKYMVSVRFISWQDKKYTIESNPLDYLDYQKLTWKASGKRKAETLEAKDFVYKKFGGSIINPNEAAPKIMKCLTQIENLDKALRDWRQINHIFAGPILFARCENSKEVTAALNAMDDKNFKLKKLLAGTFDLEFLKLDIKGVDSIEKEIEANAKVISATTGIPVHFLGFVELMSNRATAENLMEMIIASTTKEHATWIGVYEEVLRKAMFIWNAATKKGMSKNAQLDPDKIKVEIPLITKTHYERLEKIYLPACLGGKISDEAFLAMIPGFDVKAELERKKKNEESELQHVKNENKDLKNKELEKNLFEEE